MLHHVSLGVADIKHSASSNDAVFAPLGFVRVWDDIRPGEADQAVGYGLPRGGDKLAIKHRPEKQSPPGSGFHLAFAAPNRDAVYGFYEAALSNGGSDNGKPGLRPDYGANNFAAYVLDPDGHHIEAVYNHPE